MYVQMFMVIPGLGSRSRSEPIFFGCSVPAEEKNQESEAEPLQKKRGAGAAQKKPGAGAAKIRRLRLLMANN